MVFFEAGALICCSLFFGAALYISMAQHPASMKAGIDVAAAFFTPMYAHAAPF
jgi:hypothetical protein